MNKHNYKEREANLTLMLRGISRFNLVVEEELLELNLWELALLFPMAKEDNN